MRPLLHNDLTPALRGAGGWIGKVWAEKPKNTGPAVTASEWALMNAWRFVLAFIVLLAHVAIPGVTVGAPSLMIHDWGAYPAVLSFFVMSGFFIASSLEKGTAGYYRRRFIRLAPLYYLGLGLALLPSFLSRHGLIVYHPASGTVSTSAVVAAAFMLSAWPVGCIIAYMPAWSLSYECAYYVMAKGFARLPDRFLWAVMGASIVYFVCQPTVLHGWDLQQSWGPLRVFTLLWSWLLGFMAYRTRSSRILNWVVLGLIGAASLQLYNPAMVMEHPPILCGILLVVGTALLIDRRIPAHLSKRAIGACNYLGDMSYALYILQFPVILSATAVIRTHSPSLAAPIAGGIAVVVSLLAVVCFDRPARKALTRWLLHSSINSRLEKQDDVTGNHDEKDASIDTHPHEIEVAKIG